MDEYELVNKMFKSSVTSIKDNIITVDYYLTKKITPQFVLFELPFRSYGKVISLINILIKEYNEPDSTFIVIDELTKDLINLLSKHPSLKGILYEYFKNDVSGYSSGVKAVIKWFNNDNMCDPFNFEPILLFERDRIEQFMVSNANLSILDDKLYAELLSKVNDADDLYKKYIDKIMQYYLINYEYSFETVYGVDYWWRYGG